MATFDEVMNCHLYNSSNFQSLKKLIANDLVVPFVGAGMTAKIYPLWETFLKKVATSEGYTDNEIHDIFKKCSYEEVANILNIDDFRIKQIISNEYSKTKINNSLDSMSIRLLPHLFCGMVVTTNFDLVLEEVYKKEDSDFERIISPINNNMYMDALRGNEHYLLKFHGDVLNNDELILTKTHYEKYYNEVGDVTQALSSIFLGKYLLFLGCSIKSDRTIDILSESVLKNKGIRHFAFVEKPKSIQEYRKRDDELSKLHIMPIWYPHGDHDSVGVLLQKIIDELPSKKVHGKHSKVNIGDFVAISKDRLLNWKSVNGRLHELLQQKEMYIPMKLRYKNENIKALDVLNFLKNQENRHGVLIGEGGMGKSTICLNIWEQCLSNNQLVFYMPLNEYNSNVGYSVINYINKYYITDNYDDYKISKLIKEMPIILLLDGFNELNPNCIYSFLQEIKDIREWSNLQIIITSRVSLNDQMYISEFSEIEIGGIEYEEINKYLMGFNQHISDVKLYKVLVNPMMLLIYVNSFVLSKKPFSIQNIFKLKFIESPISNGEVILNFLNHEILKSEMICNEGIISYIFIYYVIPYVAYNIELSENQYFFSYKELCKYLNDFASKVLNEYIKNFDILLMCKNEIKKLDLYNSEVLEVLFQNINGRSSILCKNDNNEFYFTHQIFRDVFSAIHIKNQMILGNNNILVRRVLPYYLRDILSDILQEHKAQSAKDSKALNYLKIFKGQFNDKSQTAIYNIFDLYQKSNCTDFSNFDFSNLDLRKCNLSKYNLNNCNFSESYINKQTVLLARHTKQITNLFCNPDGKTFITASDDGKVIVWNLESGYAIHILEFCKPSYDSDTWAYDQDTPHIQLDNVTSINTNQVGDKIIVCGNTSTIKIWDNNTGKLLRSLPTGSTIVNSAYFNKDGDRILSCSESFLYGDDEQKIEIWDYNTGKVIKSNADYRSGTITHACYSLDGKYIFLLSKWMLEIWDKDMIKLQESIPAKYSPVIIKQINDTGTIIDNNLFVKLWFSKTGHILQYHNGFSNEHYYVDGFSSISFDNKKILKIDYDNKNNSNFLNIINMSELCEGISYENITKGFKKVSFLVSSKFEDNTVNTLANILKIVENQNYSISHAVFSRNGQSIILVTTDNKIRIWDVNANQERMSITGSYQLSLDNNIYYRRSKWASDSYSMEPRDSIIQKSSVINPCLSYTLDGREIVIRFKEQITKICDVFTGKIVKTMKVYEALTVNNYSINGLEIISMGSSNEAYSDDTKIYIYNTNDKSCFSLSGHNTEVMDAVFSPNGQQIVSISADLVLIIWEKDDSTFKIMYQIPIIDIDIYNCNFKNIKTDNITQKELEQIERNGGII